MGTLEKFNLSWDGFEANIKVALKEVRDEREFSDVTLVGGDGKQVKANKVILAGGSTFFFNILRENPHPHPLIYLKGVTHPQLLSLLDFLYTGEASIAEEDLNNFLDIAEDLKVKGLTPPGSQTKSKPSISAPLQSQEVAEEPGPSPKVSYPHSTTSSTPASLQNQYDTSASIQSQLTAAGSDTTPMISRPLKLLSALQGEGPTEELVHSAKASRPLSMATSDSDNVLQQATYKKDHVSTNNIKVEVGDTEKQFIRHVSIRDLGEEHGNIGRNSNISNPEVFVGNFVNNQRVRDIYQGIGLSDKQKQNDPKEEVSAHSDDLNYDWYKRGEESKRMRTDEPEDYDYFDLDEMENSNCDMGVIEAADNIFINEQSTQACDERSKENCDDMMPDVEQDINRKKCDICAKTFATWYKLQKHKMSHNGQKFQCSVCFKMFPTISILKEHEKIHTDEKFQCLVCFKRFSRMTTLKQHEGMHTGDNPYSCLQCSRKFALKSRLDTHMMIHTGEQPYQCLVCSKKFSQFGNLKKHEKVHTGDTVEKPYQCVVCFKQFSYESSFQNHKRIHINEKQF